MNCARRYAVAEDGGPLSALYPRLKTGVISLLVPMPKAAAGISMSIILISSLNLFKVVPVSTVEKKDIGALGVRGVEVSTISFSYYGR